MPLLLQGPEDDVLWFWLSSYRTNGPLQERHVDPQPQGDPDNQRQQKKEISRFDRGLDLVSRDVSCFHINTKKRNRFHHSLFI